MSTKKPLRSKLATSVSRSAAALSRATGRGDGSVIGGKIGLMIDPNLLANLAAGRQIALISGTNGKTTTTRLTAAALGVLGEVATNSFGANMPTGHTTALARAGDTPYAVLEVDEHYLPQVLTATKPHVVALLNLSRDQLDRAKEVAMIAELWRETLIATPVHVVANADDPMITWAASGAIRAATTPATAAPTGTTLADAAPADADVTWVAAGQRWHDDSWVCPECGSHIERADGTLPMDASGAAPVAEVGSSGMPEATDTVAATLVQSAATGSASTDSAATGSASMDSASMDSTVVMTVLAPDEMVTTVLSAITVTDTATTDTATTGSVTVRDTFTDTVVITDIVAVSAIRASPGTSAGTSRDDWWCTGCTLRRPVPAWRVDGDAVVDPTGKRHVVTLALPGRVNRANAATALAVAAHFGVDPADAVPRLASVASIAGRYAQVDRDGRNIRLLLAKNPAGWLEAFDMAEKAPTLLSINSRDPDGLDTSWLFDVDFSPLRDRPVLITGDRAFDLAVRLEVNDIEFTHVKTFTEALAAVPPGRLEVIANYTAFQDIRAELDRVN